MVEEYLALETGTSPGRVALRAASSEAELLFGRSTAVRSEAMVRLDLDGAVGLMVFGAEDPDRFGPEQGTELITFFGDVVERLLAQRLQSAGPEA